MKVTFQLILERLPMKDICKRNSRKFYSRTYSQPFYFFPPFPSIPQCLFFRPIFTPLDGPNSHLLLLTRKIVNREKKECFLIRERRGNASISALN